MFKVLLLISLLAIGLQPAISRADCDPRTFAVALSTPVSSRISHVGDPVEAITSQPFLGLPTGSTIHGHVSQLVPGKTKSPGQVLLLFTQGLDSGAPFTAVAATEDGWIHIWDENGPAWQDGLQRSTRLLNLALRRKLPADRSVWNGLLGINESNPVDVGTDDFMHDYHRHDVLMGAGDRLILRSGCR